MYNVYKALAENNQIIVCSGREGSQIGESKTKQWLADNGIIYNQLWMRQAGDSRSDEIIKKEIYDTRIKNNYNIKGVFDDRKRVCRMWESLGLTVFRCGPEYDFDIAR